MTVAEGFDANANLWIHGNTFSQNLPVTSDAFQLKNGGPGGTTGNPGSVCGRDRAIAAARRRSTATYVPTDLTVHWTAGVLTALPAAALRTAPLQLDGEQPVEE